MWFWVFYRVERGRPVFLGWRHPWDGHEGHDHYHEVSDSQLMFFIQPLFYMLFLHAVMIVFTEVGCWGIL
ncbi:hypothetical protein QJS04_geneDACA004369 [Acorus gramineus]|uniref:Uncharacterized protein n=1 Tax=Acorus gramineus TaxID=55184 RepID=A0AAV9B4I5_ACOGR|nr:hypothetical protein QJS04_geneDACA004369 [Acorus gramineus]